VLLLAAGAALVVVEVAVAAVERGRARTAADAAALAAALVEPAAAPDAAVEAAARNDGVVLDVVATGTGATVQVRVGRAIVTSTAASSPPRADPGGPSPALVAALDRAEAVLGQPIPLVAASAWGVSVDAEVASRLAEVVDRTGLCPRSVQVDPVDFEACPPTPP
jgi:hypothetical protein